MKYEKIYEVEFLKYTNSMKNSVSDHPGSGRADCMYLDTSEPFLVRESELDLYRHFGGGYRSTKFVGMLPITDFGIAEIENPDSKNSVEFGFNNVEDIPNNADVSVYESKKEEL